MSRSCARLRRGDDPAALMELYDRLAPLIYGYALTRTTPHTAVTVCRDALLSAWQQPTVFGDDRVPMAFTMLLIARRELADTTSAQHRPATRMRRLRKPTQPKHQRSTPERGHT